MLDPKEPQSKCYHYALGYIYHYPKTESELKTKLLQKGYSEFDSDQAIFFLKYKGYVNDKTFAQSYIHGEIVNKGKPLFMVKKKLYHKGVEKSLVHEVFKEYEEEIATGIKKKILKDIDLYKKRGVEGFDIIQKLLRKGYLLDQIKEVIKERKN